MRRTMIVVFAGLVLAGCAQGLLTVGSTWRHQDGRAVFCGYGVADCVGGCQLAEANMRQCAQQAAIAGFYPVR